MTGKDDKPNNDQTPAELYEKPTMDATDKDPVDNDLENNTTETGSPETNDTSIDDAEKDPAANSTKSDREPIDETSTKKTPPVIQAPVTDKKSGGSSKGFLFLLLLWVLLIAGVGIGGYYGWQDYQKQMLRLQALEANASEQINQQQNLSQQLNQQQQAWAGEQQQQYRTLQDAQAVLQQRLDSHSARIQGLAGTSRQDWLLAEVRYLLRLANQRLLVEQNTLGAQGLLEAADKILQSIDDNGLLPVRDALAKELIALKIADTVDKEGLYLKISALKAQIQALPLIPFLQEDKSAQNISLLEKTEVVDEEPIWYQKIFSSVKNSLANIGDLIQIRKHDTTPELLISEQQQYQVLNHLTLMLEQAQFALLHEKKAIYRDSLSKAEQWWSTYYGHYREHETIKNEITQLKQQAVTQTLPDISRSSKLISEYIEQFHQTDRSATANNKPEDNNTNNNEEAN